MDIDIDASDLGYDGTAVDLADGQLACLMKAEYGFDRQIDCAGW